MDKKNMKGQRKTYQNLDMASVIKYMKNHVYPRRCTEAGKRNLRKRSKSFILKDDKLYYIGTKSGKGSHAADKKQERLVLTDYDDQMKAIAAVHIDAKGVHLGRDKVGHLIAQKYYWIGISNMVREYSVSCPVCRNSLTSPPPPIIASSSKAIMPVRAETESDMEDDIVSSMMEVSDFKAHADWPFKHMDPVSSCFWDVVEVSILGPFDSLKGPKFIIAFLDLYSNWIEAFVQENVSQTVITHLVINLICRFGIMKSLVMKKYTSFELVDCTPLVNAMKETADITINVYGHSVYNSDSQWKEITDCLTDFITNNTEWESCLYMALLPLRISRTHTADYTPAFLTYGRELDLPENLSHHVPHEDGSADPQLTPSQMKSTTDTLMILYQRTQNFVDEEDKNYFKTDDQEPEYKSMISDGEDDENPDYDDDDNDSKVLDKQNRSSRGRLIKKKRPFSALGDVVTYDENVEASTEENAGHGTHRKTIKDLKMEAPKPPKIPKVSLKDSPGFKINEKTSEHSYAGNPQFQMGLQKFYSAMCMYIKEKKYPHKADVDFKRTIRHSVKKYKMEGDDLVCIVGGLTRKVPITLEERISLLKQAHDVGKGDHRTCDQMLEALADYTWKGVRSDCLAFIRACPDCMFERDLLNVTRNSGKDEMVAEIAQKHHDLLCTFLKKENFPTQKLKEKHLSVKKIAHLFKIQDGSIYLKETKVAPARCLELTAKARKTAIKNSEAKIDSSSTRFVELLYKEVCKHHIWNGMKRDILNYAKDNSNSAEEFEDSEKVTEKLPKNLQKLAPRVKEYRKYFDTPRRSTRVEMRNKERLTSKDLNEDNSNDNADNEGSFLEISAECAMQDSSEKPTSSSPEKSIPAASKESTSVEIQSKDSKVFLVSTVRNEVQEVHKAPVTIHIEEVNENSSEDVFVGSVEEVDDNAMHLDEGKNEYLSLSQISSDPVTAAAVKSILDIGPDTLVRANRAIKQPQVSEILDKDSVVLLDLDEFKRKAIASQNDQSLAKISDDLPDTMHKDDVDETIKLEPCDKTEIGDGATQFDEEGVGNHVTHTCSLCNKVIRGIVKYKMHMYSHTGEKPFKCNFCDKKFTTPKSKQLHMRKHVGFSPYLCSICGKSFSLSGSLRAHIRIHERGGNVVVKCKLCDREFASKNRYDRHMQFKHPANPPVFKCEECNKTFTTLRAQKRHNMSHHLQLKCHLCVVCGKQFYRKEYLTSHMMQHPNVGEPITSKRPRKTNQKSIMKNDHVEETAAETLSPALDTNNEVIEHVVLENYSMPQEVSTTVTEPHVTGIYTSSGVQVENTFYAIEAQDGDQGMGQTVVYGYPTVQYEVECSSGTELDSEALSAINLLAQASVNQENVTFVTDGY